MPPLFTHPPSSLATPLSVFRCLSTVISFGSNIRNIDLSTCTRNLLENICVSFIVAPNRAYSINICNKIYAYNGNNGRINKSDSSFRVLTLRPSFPLRTVDSPLLFPSPFGETFLQLLRCHRFLLLGIFPRSIPRGNAIRSRTPLSYIFIRSRKRDNAKGNYGERDGPLADRSIYARGKRRRSYLQRFPAEPSHMPRPSRIFVRRVWKRTYVGCDDDDDVDHLSILERAIFFFGITILPFAGKGKKKNARAAGRGRGKKCSTRAHDCGITA